MSILQPSRFNVASPLLIGAFPEAAWVHILQWLPLADITTTARTCRRLALLAQDERVWKRKLLWLDFKSGDDSHKVVTPPSQHQSTFSSPIKEPQSAIDDTFGDFVVFDAATSLPPIEADVGNRASGDLLMLFDDEGDQSSQSKPKKTASKAKSKTASVSLATFKSHFAVLLPYYVSLQHHTTSSLLFTTPLPPLKRAYFLSTLERLLSPSLAPTRSPSQISAVRRNLQSATDFFESAMLAAFERAYEVADEPAMRGTASALWELDECKEVKQAFVNKIPIFYDQSYDPLKNIVKTPNSDAQLVDGLDFDAMDNFMKIVLRIVTKEGSAIARIFPPKAEVLLYFADRIATDVISEYIIPLLSAAQSLQNPLFLLAVAAAFAQSMRLVDAILAIEPSNPLLTREKVEDCIYRMFEIHMDDYLQEEGEWIREVLEGICAEWDKKLGSDRAFQSSTFLTSSNPALVKRTYLASFTKALLLPVTIVPKTIGYSLNAIASGSAGAFSTVAGLATGSQNRSVSGMSSISTAEAIADETPIEESEDLTSSGMERTSSESRFAKLQLLLSLDVALSLIQSDRDCLKRIQTFRGYPAVYGQKVKDALDEAFIILLQTMSEKHIKPAFRVAFAEMNGYQPADHDNHENVAPLVQFFELVHVGDTILQMVQVLFDKEMAYSVDRNDFLSPVLREKKRFEISLDDGVAQGLNTGVNLLMNQTEHVLLTRQLPTDFAPAENSEAQMDLIPTKACIDAIECLKRHCAMLKGSTDKQILEVFHQEVALRLHGLLCKHLKRSIISLTGGFQVIADLNAYHSFVISLRLPQVTPYFIALKMAANIYIVDNPKDIGNMVRDVDRYEGTLRMEDVLEFAQRRKDWALIEKAVDKEVFGFKGEDCILA